MARRPLLGRCFFFGTFLCGRTLRAKGISVSIDDLCFAAGGGQGSSRRGLGRRFAGVGLAGEPLGLGFGGDLGERTLLPIGDDLQISGTHAAVVQARVLSAR